MNNVETSVELIRSAIDQSKRAAAMLSFGKDSMVLAHLIRLAGNSTLFPIEVIYHREPWFAQKHEFADHVISSWGMVVYDFLPCKTGVKVKPNLLELVARYNFGWGSMDIPKNVSAPEEHPRRDYICGLNDWLLRPRAFMLEYPWDTVFMGHRSADVDQFEGPVPLKCDETKVGGVRLLFPLRDWTDDELWDSIESERIPVQETRYEGRKEIADKWYNNDYVPACTACIDPRETRATVFCPKLKCEVKNQGGAVIQLHAQPDYWERAA